MGVNVVSKGRPIAMPGKLTLPSQVVFAKPRNSKTFPVPRSVFTGTLDQESNKEVLKEGLERLQISRPGQGHKKQGQSKRKKLTSSATAATSGVYFNNVELKGSMHPLQNSGKNNVAERVNIPFTALGRPLLPAPGFPNYIVTVSSTSRSSENKNDAVRKAPLSKRAIPSSGLPEQPRVIRRRLDSITKEEKLFLEATVALSTVK